MSKYVNNISEPLLSAYNNKFRNKNEAQVFMDHVEAIIRSEHPNLIMKWERSSGKQWASFYDEKQFVGGFIWAKAPLVFLLNGSGDLLLKKLTNSGFYVIIKIVEQNELYSITEETKQMCFGEDWLGSDVDYNEFVISDLIVATI